MEVFRLKPEVVTGSDSLNALEELNAARTLVVTDGFWTASGGITQVVGRLKGQVRVFDGVKGEPSTETVAEGVAAFREFQPEALVALGGGSVLDAAKAIRKYALPEGRQVPLWALPTTGGTGSEVTSFAVISEKGQKLPLVEDSLLPERAILWGGFLESLPSAALADAGMDALSHALEAGVAKKAGPCTDALAREALAGLWSALPRAVELDSAASRETLLYGSCLAGMSFNSAGLGLCHGLSHALGARFHLPHGRLNAVLLPAVIDWNADGGDPALWSRYAALARACGLSAGEGRSAVWALSRGLRRLRRRLKLPETLCQAGVERGALLEALPEIQRAALEDICTAGNPRPVTAEGVETVLREAL